MDMSLDDLIKQNRSVAKRGAGRGRGRGASRGSTRGQSRIRQRGTGQLRSNIGKRGAAATRPLRRGSYTTTAGRGRGSQRTTKLMISNLDYGVTDADVKELFGEFGATRSASVHYDKSGRSLGTAHVVFERYSDAARAVKTYGGVPLDGRPMKLELATDQLAPAGGGASRGARGASRGVRGARGAGRGGRGAGRGGRQQAAQKKPTAEQLDAELDAYVRSAK